MRGNWGWMRRGLSPRGPARAISQGASSLVVGCSHAHPSAIASKHPGEEVCLLSIWRDFSLTLAQVMRALTQFLASRSYSYGKAYISHDTEVCFSPCRSRHLLNPIQFRTITGLHHHQAFAPHMLNGTSLPESDVEDVETSMFIKDMEGAMKVYWKTVMSNAHGRM